MNERLHGLDPRKLFDIGKSYAEKAARNSQNGITVYEKGTIRPFEGYDAENVRGLYNYVLLLDENSQTSILERIIDPVQTIAESNGIQGIFAGSADLPPHITLQTGNFRGVSPEEQQRMEEDLSSPMSHLRLISRIMTGHTAHLNNIVLAGSSFYADSQGFMHENARLFRARQLIKWAYTGERNAGSVDYSQQESSEPQSGLNPVNYDDITHVSIGRITDTASSSQLMGFMNQVYAEVLPQLQSSPVEVKVSGVYQGSAHQFFQENRPNLIKK